MAYTADKGEKLLDLASGQVGGMGPPMTYLLDGKQYIAFMGGIGVPPGPGAVAPPFAFPRGFAPVPAGEPTAAAAQRGQGPPPAPSGPATIRPKLYVYTLDAAKQ
jgi:hypothetical protein